MTDGGDVRRGVRTLIAEDERHLGLLLEHFLVARGHHVTVVHDGRDALERLRTEAYDVALLDVQMPGLDGLAVLRGVRELMLPPEIIIMTGNGTVDTALAVMQGGAYDYVAKPYRMAEIDLLVRRAAERRALACEGATARDACAPNDEMVTCHAPLRALIDRVDRAAPSLRTMLVHGEPGTGRSMLACRVHERAGGSAFVVVDCALVALGDHAPLDRALLTGDATVYLRMVERLPVVAQRRIADAMSGAAAERARPPARVIASTAQPLGTSIAGEALAARLSELAIELPPLRDRHGDVALLAETFVRRFGGGPSPAITPAALARLESHGWPGNVAELRLVIEGAVARAASGVLGPEDIFPVGRRAPLA